MKAALILFVSLVLVAGCYTPQFMPATDIQCRVVDAESKKAISGADLFMVYVGASGQTTKRGPFRTDVDGRGRIVVEREAVWQSGAEAGFAGGHLRHIEVEAAGYEGTGFWENFDRGLIEKKAPFVFELQPFRNYFGAVHVLGHDTRTYTQQLDLEVLDGPHAGERFILPIMPPKSAALLSGRKLYLRKPLEEIRAETIRYKIVAHNLEELLREGFPDEPYAPKKTEPNQSPQPTRPTGG
jgi:hypothetical protein